MIKSETERHSQTRSSHVVVPLCFFDDDDDNNGHWPLYFTTHGRMKFKPNQSRTLHFFAFRSASYWGQLIGWIDSTKTNQVPLIISRFEKGEVGEKEEEKDVEEQRVRMVFRHLWSEGVCEINLIKRTPYICIREDHITSMSTPTT